MELTFGTTPEGNREFGELFHAAAFIAIDGSHKVAIRGSEKDWKKTEEFLNSISAGSCRIRNQGDKKQIPSITRSADVFLKRMHESLPDVVAGSILPKLEVTDQIRERAKKLEIEDNSCLLWIRHGSQYQPERDLPFIAYKQLLGVLIEARYKPILIGAEAPYATKGCQNLVRFYDDVDFADNPKSQLSLLNHICECYPVKFSIGAKSGAMDGLAFARKINTIYFTHPDKNGRMDKVERVFPAFKKVETSYRKKFLSFTCSELEDIYEKMA